MTGGVFGSVVIFQIYRKIQQRKQMKKSILDLENLEKVDENWDWTSIRQDVEDTFYKVQIAWTEMNQDIAKGYVSDKLYHKHKNQIEEMRLKNHRNIIVDMSLLNVKPMGVTDYEGINNDSLWVCIEARAIDYTINQDTNYVLEGDKNKYECFEEYWRFVRKNDRWVLDEIKQIAEINNMDFFNCSIHER